ncbi:glycosyltransferase [Effusibacillus pohliae]|uniref:glycosyltransferase n=1 Tax=Effusibacillus pohliae TaxID=232270 RepID=UPI000363DAED|nr:glycosyltransferase [Effusibacillus pohliae]
MVKVAVVRSWYLPLSETFIYSELVNLRVVSPVVCTKRILNLKHFPFHPIFQFKRLPDLERILREQNIDLIHARFGTTGAEILNVKKKLGLPMLTSFHGFDLPSNRVSLAKYKGNLQRLFAEGEAFTVTSENMREVLLRFGCPSEKIRVHHSGIDVDRFAFKQRTFPADGKIILLSVGRLVEKKGMNYLLDAFHKVQQEYPNICLRIAGDGPYRERLRQQARSLRIQHKVEFLGEIPHQKVAEAMQQAHLFALASVTTRNGNQEGIPNVLKEAMATGLPVVATSHAGIPELVKHKKSGYLVRERDSAELAKRLLDLIRNPHKWGKMGEKGRKTVIKSFRLQTQVLELEKMYADILTNR